MRGRFCAVMGTLALPLGCTGLHRPVGWGFVMAAGWERQEVEGDGVVFVNVLQGNFQRQRTIRLGLEGGQGLSKLDPGCPIRPEDLCHGGRLEMRRRRMLALFKQEAMPPLHVLESANAHEVTCQGPPSEGLAECEEVGDVAAVLALTVTDGELLLVNDQLLGRFVPFNLA